MFELDEVEGELVVVPPLTLKCESKLVLGTLGTSLFVGELKMVAESMSRSSLV
jgi:hypothetical protein